MNSSLTLHKTTLRRGIADPSAIDIESNVKPLRFMILQRECLNLPITTGREVVRVLSGCAWISYEGQDIVLQAGEQHTFQRGHFSAVITAEGKQSLIIEWLPTVARSHAVE